MRRICESTHYEPPDATPIEGHSPENPEEPQELSNTLSDGENHQLRPEIPPPRCGRRRTSKPVRYVESLQTHRSQNNVLETPEQTTSGQLRKKRTDEKKTSKHDNSFCMCNDPRNQSLSIQCGQCRKTFHRKCIKMTLQEYRELEESKQVWTCSDCCPIGSDVTSAKSGTDIIIQNLIHCRRSIQTIRRVPKNARSAAADKLIILINSVIYKNTLSAWEDLLLFSYKCFSLGGDQEKNLTKKIKDNVKNFEIPKSQPPKKNTISFLKRVEAKLSDFDVKGAIRLLSSEDSIAPNTEDTLQSLVSKHPPPSRQQRDLPDPSSVDIRVTLIDSEVFKGINTFATGSAPGIDGLRPQHLKDLVSKSAGPAGRKALTAITNLCNFILHGKANKEIAPILYGATLCAIGKKDGGVRPIACGNTFRRLTGRVMCTKLSDKIRKRLNPHQVGVATKRGCESTVHTVRTYINDKSNESKVLLKIDFKNAFNTVERDSILCETYNHVPELYPLLYECYSQPSLLFYEDKTLMSQRGAHQGCPCSPMGFSLAVQPIVETMTSELNVWYLDDATLADKPDTVLEDLMNLIKNAAEVGLEVNTSKCELYFCSGTSNTTVIENFQAVCPGIRITPREDLELLGTPLFADGIEKGFTKKSHQIQLLTKRLTGLNAHTAYFLLRNCLFVPKLTYFLRTCEVWKFTTLTNEIDDHLKMSFTSLFNIQLDDHQWRQSTLPVKYGGIGIRQISDIALPCFLSSIAGAKELMSDLLPFMDTTIPTPLEEEAIESWELLNDENATIPTIQKYWDEINIRRIKSTLPMTDDAINNARLLAIETSLSGAWLNCIPSQNIGTRMDSQDFQTCLALRLGCNQYQPHECICGKNVDKDGLHGLSCKKCQGRFARHTELNHIIQRALCSIQVMSTLEPSGLSRDDGKRPDGVTLAPWEKGRRLVWDVTCVDTLAASYIKQTMKTPGAAAEIAAKKKHDKYSQIKADNFKFIALAFETLGTCSEETTSFLNRIGGDLIEESGDPRAREYLYQRISMAIQRGNAASIRGTSPNQHDLQEIYLL